MPTRSQFLTGCLLLLIAVVAGWSRLHGQAPLPSDRELEGFPKHFVLHPGEQIHYQVLELTTLFSRRANDAQAYEGVVVPFLDRMIKEFPVAGNPADAPRPPLSDLLNDWSVVVRFGERFERIYRRGDSNKTLLLEFQGV